jgi:hypothetical protein
MKACRKMLAYFLPLFGYGFLIVNGPAEKFLG